MTRAAILAAFALAVLPAIARAQVPERPLPPFALAAPDGAAVSSASLAPGRRVVLAIVRPSCRPCEQMLNALARVEDVAAGSGLLLVVESPLDEAASFAAHRLPQPLAGVRWYADANGEAWAALGVKGLPLLVGLDGARIAWTHSGVPDRSLLESLMRTWIGTAEVSR